MKATWIALVVIVGAASAQDGGLVGGIGRTLKTSVERGADAASVLESETEPTVIAKAEAELDATLSDLKVQVEIEPRVVLPHLDTLEERLEQASYAEGPGQPVAERALGGVLQLRRSAHRLIESGTFKKRGKRFAGRRGGVVRGFVGRPTPSARPQTPVEQLESFYAGVRALLAGEREAQSLLGTLTDLDLRLQSLSGEVPVDPADAEKLSLKLQEGEALFGDLAAAVYLRYRDAIREHPASSMIEFTAYLQRTPKRAKRARRQGTLLLGAVRRVWSQQHVDLDLFKGDYQARVQRLVQVRASWREAIGQSEDHPLEVELAHLDQVLATIERRAARQSR